MTTQPPTESQAPAMVRQAPAKLNFSLRVLGRRDDGFHEIETLMVPLAGLHDAVSIARSEGLHFSCNDAGLPTDEGNLVVRAARVFAEAMQARGADFPGVRIHLEKSIPHGAGLGGGSSDAAATLLGLQDLHGGVIGAEDLHELAAGLGSDVPFFLQEGPARCRGRGEIVTPAPDALAGQLPVLLLKPHFPVLTVDAYRRVLDPTLDPVPGVPSGPIELDGLELVNDLERPVFAKHRFLAELKLWLLERPECRAAMMSGSGSTVFAILHAEVDADALARAARHELDSTLWSWHGMAG